MESFPNETVGLICSYLSEETLYSILKSGVDVNRGVKSREYWKGKLEILLGVVIPDEVLPGDLRNLYNEFRNVGASNGFAKACELGYIELVEYMAGLPRVDPTARNNEAIRMAAKNGHLDVVKFLSTLPGVNPAASSNYAIRKASRNGYLDVVEFLRGLQN